MNEARGRVSVARCVVWSLVLILALPLSAAAKEWDIYVKTLFPARYVQEGGQGKAGETLTSVVQGEQVLIVCQYAYTQVGDMTDFPKWMAHIRVDSVGKSDFIEQYVPEPKVLFYLWKAEKPIGPRKISCDLEFPGDANSSNNKAETTITVTPRPPLTPTEIPAPTPSMPTSGQKIALVPNLKFQLVALMPKTPVAGYSSFTTYHIGSTYQQHWHVEIEHVIHSKVSPAKNVKTVSPRVGEFQGKVDALFLYGATLTRAWLDERGAKPGRYAARFYLSETANSVTTKGPKSSVEFELVEGVKAGSPPSQNWSEAGPAVPSVPKAPAASSARPAPAAPTVALTGKLEQLAQRIKATERRDNERSTICPECVDLQRRLDGIRRQLHAGLAPALVQQLTIEADRLSGDVSRLEATRGLPAVQGTRTPEPPSRGQPAPATR